MSATFQSESDRRLDLLSRLSGKAEYEICHGEHSVTIGALKCPADLVQVGVPCDHSLDAGTHGLDRNAYLIGAGPFERLDEGIVEEVSSKSSGETDLDLQPASCDPIQYLDGGLPVVVETVVEKLKLSDVESSLHVYESNRRIHTDTHGWSE